MSDSGSIIDSASPNTNDIWIALLRQLLWACRSGAEDPERGREKFRNSPTFEFLSRERLLDPGSDSDTERFTRSDHSE